MNTVQSVITAVMLNTVAINIKEQDEQAEHRQSSKDKGHIEHDRYS